MLKIGHNVETLEGSEKFLQALHMSDQIHRPRSEVCIFKCFHLMGSVGVSFSSRLCCNFQVNSKEVAELYGINLNIVAKHLCYLSNQKWFLEVPLDFEVLWSF